MVVKQGCSKLKAARESLNMPVRDNANTKIRHHTQFNRWRVLKRSFHRPNHYHWPPVAQVPSCMDTHRRDCTSLKQVLNRDQRILFPTHTLTFENKAATQNAK